MANGDKMERKWLAHYIDSNFGSGTASYIRLGKDLEEYNIELNPDSETIKNILGENNTNDKGYEVSSNVDTFFAREGDALFAHLSDIVNNRSVGSELETTAVDVLVDSTGTVVWAYRENVLIIPQSIGGDTSGIQIPYQIIYNGSRTSGTWDVSTKTFTPSAGTLGKLTIQVVKGDTATTTKVSDVIGETSESNLKYKLGGSSLTQPNYGDSDTGYTDLTKDTAITVTSAQTKIVVVESNSSNQIIASSPVTAVVTGA